MIKNALCAWTLQKNLSLRHWAELRHLCCCSVLLAIHYSNHTQTQFSAETVFASLVLFFFFLRILDSLLCIQLQEERTTAQLEQLRLDLTFNSQTIRKLYSSEPRLYQKMILVPTGIVSFWQTSHTLGLVFSSTLLNRPSCLWWVGLWYCSFAYHQPLLTIPLTRWKLALPCWQKKKGVIVFPRAYTRHVQFHQN